MSGRRWRCAGLLAIAVVLVGCDAGAPSGPPERIVLIVVDTLRRDHVSAYADTVPTPNVDRLARRGQVFQNAVSAFHATTMSMAAIFSGRTPSLEFGDARATLDWNSFASCGLSRFATDADDACVPGVVETLAEDLRAAGYWTAGVVANKLLFRPYGYDQGFDEWVEVGRDPEGQEREPWAAARHRTAVHVNNRVFGTLARRPGDRFFLYVHYVDVHDWILFGISYAESVRRFDRRLGELLDTLEAEGLLENAAVVLTSDHGEMLVERHLDFDVSRHYGNPSFEPLLRVPLIVSPSTGRDPDALVRGQDLRSLVREIAGLEGEPPPELEPGELLVTERFFQTYRTKRWKSIWKRLDDRVLLFDLEADPDEMEDLSRDRPEILAAHRRRVDEIVPGISSADRDEQHLNPEDLERLRALGYLE